MKINKAIIKILIAYLVLMLIYALIRDLELRDNLTCCGLYGYYERFHFPLPLVESSKWSTFGGGPTRILFGNLMINLLIPAILVVAGALVARLKKIFEI